MRRFEKPRNESMLAINPLEPDFIPGRHSGYPNADRILGIAQASELLRKAFLAFPESLIEPLQAPGDVQRHVLDFPHSHLLASILPSYGTTKRCCHAMGREPRFPDANDDHAAVPPGLHADNFEPGKLRIHTIAEHMLQAIRHMLQALRQIPASGD